MAKLYGHAPNKLVPQDDFHAYQNENGGWECTQSFNIRKGDISNQSVYSIFVVGTRLSEYDPNCDEIFTGMRLSKMTGIHNVPGGWQKITLKFVGFTTTGGGDFDSEPTTVAQATFSKRGTLVDAPLDEHPKWKTLEDSEKWALGLFMKGDMAANSAMTAVGTYEEYDYRRTFATAIDNDSSPITFSVAAQEFIKRIAQGKMTYKMATYEYHHRWQSNKGVTAAQMNKLGKIATPTGSPPTPGAGRDWLLVGVDEEQNGSGDFLYDNVLSYLLSDEGGHDEFLQS
jgi:hypothetical protein